MNVKKLISWAGLLALVVAVLAGLPASTQAQSGNLLQNPGMNQPYSDGNKQPNGWGRWFREIAKPGDASALDYAVNPNFSAETNASGQFPQLILEGDASAHVGRQYDPWIGGLQQTVSNIPAGSQVRFCAYSRLFAQNANLGKEPSVTGMNGRSQVGIYPDGDVGWDNANIIWSGAGNPHDTWGQLCTEATVGASGKVTVFTKNDWRGSGAIHLDSWWDQAELVILGTQPVQPTAQPQPQATAQTQPQPTAQVQPGGGVVHTIVAGDTLFGLALQYDVPIEDIYSLNGLNSQSILMIGQQIIIRAGAGTQTPAQQPTAAPTAAPTQAPAGATPQAAETTPQTPASGEPPLAPTTAAAASNMGTLCIFAYEDTNADGQREEGDIPVAGATFRIVDGQGTEVAEYVSSDDTQPHCIDNLTPGSYDVSVQPAPDTVATSDKRWGVPLTSGSTVKIDFGSRSGEGSSTSGENTTSTDSSSGGSNLGGIVGGIVGLIALLAAGVIGAIVIARRRA